MTCNPDDDFDDEPRQRRQPTGCQCFGPGECSDYCPGPANCPMCQEDEEEAEE